MKNTLMFLLASLMLAVCLTACGGGQTNGSAGENGGQTGGTNGSITESGGQTGGTGGSVMENGGQTGGTSGSAAENSAGGSDNRDDSLMDDARDAVDDAGRSVRDALDDAGNAMERAF